jgi:dCMP deaminase
VPHELTRWDRYFFEVAEAGARMSKDPSTQCGAVIVRPNKTIASTGWNGFPRGVADVATRYADRERKLLMVVHAESNAITSARESLEGFTLYVTPLSPCANCASLIIQSGIKCVRYQAPAEVPDRWRKSFDATLTMFVEASVEFQWFGEPQ